MSFTIIAESNPSRTIWFGTTLNPEDVIKKAQQLAASAIHKGAPTWKAKGDQKRTYHFSDANIDEPYRICVPEKWDGRSKLPLVMYLHGAGSNENTYLEMNNKQMMNLAAQYGVLLVSPLGDNGAYGNYLRLTAPFGDSVSAAKLMSQVTDESERVNELSEQDIINVLELVLSEYPVDSLAIFLAGHSMGSGGTWYIGGKYSKYWRALAPMSGPFVQASGYPWDCVGKLPVFITEGVQTPSLDASRLLRDWMRMREYKMKYKEVDADHGGMIKLVLPDVFAFFDSCRLNTAYVFTKNSKTPLHYTSECSVISQSRQLIKILFKNRNNFSRVNVSILDIFGRVQYNGAISNVKGEIVLKEIFLSPGIYYAHIRTTMIDVWVDFKLVR